MLTLAAPQEECPEVATCTFCTLNFVLNSFPFCQACLTWEAWVVHPVLVLLEELAVLDLPLRRSVQTFIHCIN